MKYIVEKIENTAMNRIVFVERKFSDKVRFKVDLW